MAETSILIVGAGQIGSRHLQGLAKLEIDTRIYVVDPDENALSIAKARYDEAQMHSNKQALFFYKSLNLVKDTIDVAIIATNAKVRKKIIQTVVACVKVRYFILEKIAFLFFGGLSHDIFFRRATTKIAKSTCHFLRG